MSKSIVRSIKNVTNGYTSAQVKVRNATSNEEWGPSGVDMNEIAQLTFDDETLFEIMEIIDKRLNDKGKNWRHVVKALVLLDYCIHLGSENCVRWAKDNLYLIKTLREFQYIDEEDRDQGLSVRTRAKELTALIQNDERIRNERANRHHMRDKMREPGNEMFLDDRPDRPSRSSRHDDYDERPMRPNRSSRRPGSERNAGTGRRRTVNEDDDEELQRAIEESKATARADEIRRLGRAGSYTNEDIAYAARLSQKEQARTGNATLQSTQQTGETNLLDFASENESQQPAYLAALNTGYQSPQYTQNQQQQMYTGVVYQQPQQTGQYTQYQGQTSFQPQQQQPVMNMQVTGVSYQQQPQQTGPYGSNMQPTGQQNGQSFVAPLNADFTGAGFGGYSNQQQVPVQTGLLNYTSHLRSPLSSGYQSPQSGYQSPAGFSPMQTGYQSGNQTGSYPVDQSGMSMQQAMFQQQYQQQQQQQIMQQQSLAPQPTGKNNPFKQE